MLWLGVADALKAADGGFGLSLTASRDGWLTSTMQAAFYGLPAVGLGVLTASLLRPIAGLFVVAAALAVVAAYGGDMGGWLHYHADLTDATALPDAYQGLLLEVLIWQTGLITTMGLIIKCHRPLHRLVGRFSPNPQPSAESPHVAKAVATEALIVVFAIMAATLFGMNSLLTWLLIITVVVLMVMLKKWGDRLPGAMMMILGLLTASAMAAWVGFYLIRSTQTGQVMWSLILAFAVGTAATAMIFPGRSSLLLFLSPAVVAMISYATMMMRFDSSHAVLHAWYALSHYNELPGGLGFVLPIHFASAGMVGCCIGLSVAHQLAPKQTTQIADTHSI